MAFNTVPTPKTPTSHPHPSPHIHGRLSSSGSLMYWARVSPLDASPTEVLMRDGRKTARQFFRRPAGCHFPELLTVRLISTAAVRRCETRPNPTATHRHTSRDGKKRNASHRGDSQGTVDAALSRCGLSYSTLSPKPRKKTKQSHRVSMQTYTKSTYFSPTQTEGTSCPHTAHDTASAATPPVPNFAPSLTESNPDAGDRPHAGGRRTSTSSFSRWRTTAHLTLTECRHADQGPLLVA